MRAVQTTGTYSIYEKFARDQRLVSLFEGSTVVSLQTIAMQLKSIAKRARNPLQTPAVDVHTLFCIDAPLPALELDRLTITVRGNDTVCSFGLFDLPDRLREVKGLSNLAAVLDDGAARLRALYDDINARTADRLMQDPFWFDAARKYCDLFAIASLASLWYCNRTDVSTLSHPLFHDPLLLSGALRQRLERDASISTDSAAHYDRWLRDRIGRQEAISLLTLVAPFSAVDWEPLWSTH